MSSIVSVCLLQEITTLGDMSSYADGKWIDGEWANRTYFVGKIAFILVSNFGVIIANILFSLLNGLGIVMVLKSVPSRHRLFLLPFLFLPSATLWTGIIGKEALSSFGFALIICWWLRFLRYRELTNGIVFLLIGLLFVFFFRPHYALASVVLVIGSVFSLKSFSSACTSRSRINFLNRCSFGVIIFVFFMLLSFSVPIVISVIDKVATISLQYFPNGLGRASRHGWLEWHNTGDFWRNAWWGLPFGIIGPLPYEAALRPVFLFAFVEGVTVFVLPIAAIGLSLLFSPKEDNRGFVTNRELLRLVIFGLGPSLFLLMCLHAPMGIVNPGTAIRYRSGFEIFWIVPSLCIFLSTVRRPGTNGLRK
jgi:hypothetical protein